MGDPLNYLLELGFTLDEVETLKSRNDFTCQQMADAAKAIVDRGGNPLEAFGPRATGWEKPIPFDEIQTPDFPVEALPGPLGAFVECLAESTQTPEEMGGTLSLGVLATAFQRRYEVEVTRDWREPLCLYSSAVAPPGERKSAVISALNKPIYEYEAEVRAAEAAEIAQNQTERALLEKALEARSEAAKNSAAKGKANFEEMRAEALELSAQLAEFKDKHPFRLLADDTTPEKLVDIMDAQGGCITVSSAEGGVFDSMAGRYEKGANFDIYLKGHSGDPITVDRIGRKANHIKALRLTMMLTIQPDVLNGVMNNSTFRGRGLCGRFLYAVCKSKVGHRAISPPPVPDRVRDEYRAFVRRILSDQGSGIIRLSPEADEVRKSYQAYIEKKLGNEWEFMRDWGGKLTGAVVRIAALMHAAECLGPPTDSPISAETMASATSLGEFFSGHAEAAYQLMGANESQADAKYILKRLSAVRLNRVTRSELTRLCRGKFGKAEDMTAALNILVERRYLQEVETDVGYNNRTQIAYFINPAIAGNDGNNGNDAA
mgnify:FL=1